MTHWCRLWDDMPTDPKWRVVSRRCGRPVHQIISVFCVMMTNASTSQTRGTLSSWDDEVVAVSLDMEESEVAAIREAMQGKVLSGNELMGWEKRQPKREDPSSERVKAFREREAATKRNVTHGNGHGVAETLRSGCETAGNAPDKIRGDKIREEREEKETFGFKKEALETASPRKGARRRKAGMETPLDPLLELTQNWIDAAIKCGLARSLHDKQFEKFRDHHLSKGSNMVDWLAAWRTWVNRSIEYAAKTNHSGPTFPPGVHWRRD